MSNREKSGGIRNERGQFKPGVSGNPKGKPPGTVSIVARLKKIFEEEPDLFEDYCRKILSDPHMRKEVLEQIDSKPKQPIDIEHKFPQTLIDIIKDASIATSDETGNPDISGEN